MQATFDIDESVYELLVQIAEARDESVGDVIAELLRQAMGLDGYQVIRNGIPLFPLRPGGQMVTLEMVNELRDEE